MNRRSPSATGAPEELSRWKSRIDARLAELVAPAAGARDGLALAMREGLLGPGKRVRPLMMVGVSLGFDQDPAHLLDVACAVEMVHAASLFLDDLPCMDDAAQRRGRPALHLQFGEDTALLASVALMSRAFGVVAQCPHLGAELRTRLVALLADTIGPGGLVHGQYQDLHAAPGPAREADLARQNEMKTGVLFRAAWIAPALAGGADARTVEALAQCASHVGHAFQLRDDLDDAPREDGSGEDQGHDNLVSLLGHACARQRFEAHLAAAEGTVGTLFPHDRVLRAMLALLRPAADDHPGASRAAGRAPRTPHERLTADAAAP